MILSRHELINVSEDMACCRAYGTRAVASAWWLFALVITSSYTANLASLLAQKTPVYIISNVNDLADNDKGILYGAKAGGSTLTFFKVSFLRVRPCAVGTAYKYIGVRTKATSIHLQFCFISY